MCSVNTLVLCPIYFGWSTPNMLDNFLKTLLRRFEARIEDRFGDYYNYYVESFKNVRPVATARGSHFEERSRTITVTLRASKMSDQEGERADRKN